MTEFKKSTTDITKDVYESICAFSNRDGGHVFLGVKDNGEILGIKSDCIERMKKDFVTAINNPNKLYPPLFLAPAEYELRERRSCISMCRQVRRYAGVLGAFMTGIMNRI